MDTIFIAEPDELGYLGDGDNPADAFVGMDCQEIHTDIRAHLYAMVMDLPFEEGLALEEYIAAGSDDGPTISSLPLQLVDELALLEEDQIQEYAQRAVDSDLVQQSDLNEEDISDFLYSLVNLSRTATQESETRIYVFSV